MVTSSSGSRCSQCRIWFNNFLTSSWFFILYFGVLISSGNWSHCSSDFLSCWAAIIYSAKGSVYISWWSIPAVSIRWWLPSSSFLAASSCSASPMTSTNSWSLTSVASNSWSCSALSSGFKLLYVLSASSVVVDWLSSFSHRPNHIAREYNFNFLSSTNSSSW